MSGDVGTLGTPRLTDRKETPMKPAKFFQVYPTREELEAHVYAHPELYGKTSISQFIKDNLPLESAFQTEIIKALRDWQKKGFISPATLIWKQSAGVYNRNGMPDLMAIIDSRFIGFEVKRPYIGAVTQLQLKTIRQIRQAGGIAEVICFPAEARALLIHHGLWLGLIDTPEEGGTEA